MPVQLSDVFIGNFRMTQGFGENPDYYKKFGLKGHEGIDWATPVGTPIIAAHDGVVVRDVDDPIQGKNYGITVVVWDKEQDCATYYCHLSSNIVSVGQSVVKGQLLGYSGETGNTTGPHLHFNLCKTDDEGRRINTDNGYMGFVNPDDRRIAVWSITNPSKPVAPPQVTLPENDPVDTAFGLFQDGFHSLPSEDVNAHNIESYARAAVDRYKRFAEQESKAKQLDGFIAKWLQEWELSPNGSLVNIEQEMARFLTIEDTARLYREAMEQLVGSFDDDEALLKAVEAVKDNHSKIKDELKKCREKLLKKKVVKSFKVGNYFIKIYKPHEDQ